MAVSIPKPGDWLQHEAFGRGDSGRGRIAKRGEVIDCSSSHDIVIYMDGEPGWQTITRAEFTRWWNLWLPKPDPEDLPTPFWVAKGKHFQSPNHTATIRTVRESWVSYTEGSKDYSDVFRLVPYRTFTQTGWQPLHKPSVWEWLRRPIV